ncbi:MAG: phage holin family protein [Lachnospiraceae bacterium]|nr:phage holin family protein [Lachnospiraceae bacterium]
MNNKIHTYFIKIITVIGSSLLGSKLEILSPAMILLIFLMVVDYISGMLASKKEAVEHSNNKNYGWSSKKSLIGIYKKLGYILMILVAVSTDYIIYAFLGKMGIEFQLKTIFGFLVTIWLIINELLSILENVGRMGAKLPKFLQNILSELEQAVDDYNSKE